MICIDNSEWMRNGDYSPSRFQAQADAVNLICGAKTQVLTFNILIQFFFFSSINLISISHLFFVKKKIEICSQIQRIPWEF